MVQNFFIFADDIRFEQGNKISVMGIYDEEIVVQGQTPVLQDGVLPFRLAFFVRATLEPGETVPDSFQLWIHNGKANIPLLQGPVTPAQANGVLVLALVHPMIPLVSGQNEVRILLRKQDKESDSQVLSKSIRLTLPITT